MIGSWLFVIHPHGIARAHHRLAIDVNAAAFADTVADIDVRARDHALARAGFVAYDLVDEAFIVQKRRFAPEIDIGRAAAAFVHVVGNRVGNGVAIGEAHIGQRADQGKLSVLGGCCFVGHGAFMS